MKQAGMIPVALTAILVPLLMEGCSTRSRMDQIGMTGKPTDSVHYVVVRGGRIVSKTSTWADQSGTTIVRTQSPPDTGSAVVTQLRFDPRSGVPTWLRTNGVDVRGRVVEERFENAGGVAAWESSPESGRRESAAGAIYFPMAHAKWEAILPGLLQAAGPAPFLPRGRAWMEREAAFVVSRGAARQQVTQYAVRGLFPLASDRVWLDESGRLFADGEIVRMGWESVLPVLRDSAESARAADRQRYVRTLRRVPGRPVAIRNARLYDAHTKAVIEGATVVVRDSTIVAVGRDTVVRVPADAEVIDARGRMLLPGLWDMHSHDYGDLRSEILQLAGGVTTIRDVLRDTLVAVRLANRPGDEVAFAPNVIWAGVLDGAGGSRTVVATSDSSARLLVRRYAELGARQIKIYGRLQRSFVPTVVEEARRLGLRVGGHLAAGMNTEEAIRAGYDEISHIANITANFRGDSVYLSGAASLWRGMQNAASLDLESDSARHFIGMFVRDSVAVDATLAFVEPSVRTRSLLVRPYIASVLDRMSAGFGRGYVGWTMVEPDSMADVAAAGFATLKRLVQKFHAAGVPVLPGTDDIAGFTLHRELELYAEAGIPAADVLYLATLGAARVMGMDATLGSITVGKRADLILVDGDPLRSMGDIRRVVLTIKGGAVYDPALLYRALAIEPCCRARPVHSPGLVSRIDHVMYPGGPELGLLVEILGDKFELPVVFGGQAQTPPVPFVCFSFGNTCLEVVPLRADPEDPPPVAHIGSLALEAETFATVADSLKARGIDHFPPAAQTRWTTIGLRGFGGGMFFIEYRSGMSERRRRFREALDERHGGPLGVVRMAELSRTVRNLDEVRERWTRLFGAPVTGDPNVWTVGDGPAIRLVPVDDSLANRIVVEVQSVSVAADALRRLAVPFVQANDAIAIDSTTLLGLKVVLIGR